MKRAMVLLAAMAIGCGEVTKEQPAAGVVGQSVVAAGQCGGSGCDRPVCFYLEDEKNISQVFIDFGRCDVGDFQVFARTPFTGEFEDVTGSLKDKGGPCADIDRDFWFTLGGPDRTEPQEIHEAEICIRFEEKLSEVRVGYHAGETCEPGEVKNAGKCRACHQVPPPDHGSCGCGARCERPTCFRLEDEKNISQVFIDFVDCDVGDFRVEARTPFTGEFVDVTEALKDNGGPCGDIERDYWFTLGGPDREGPQEIREAEVCIYFEDKLSEVRVGYHAGDTCEPGDTRNCGKCEACRRSCPPSDNHCTHGVNCSRPTCFHLEDDKNLSQIFVDFGECEVGDFKVFARTPFTGRYEEVTGDLKDKGGPCNEIERDYWFTLPGPDREAPQELREADVCVLFLDRLAEVTVGYHAGDTCEEGVTKNTGKCKRCKAKPVCR